jgi:hypothetical protein
VARLPRWLVDVELVAFLQHRLLNVDVELLVVFLRPLRVEVELVVDIEIVVFLPEFVPDAMLQRRWLAAFILNRKFV